MNMRHGVGVLVTLWAGMAGLWGAEATFSERLGWEASDVVVILHVDDAGMHHASNLGVKETMENGMATSFAIMMPCPWVPEIARYVTSHPGIDAGLHLTLTSEWELYRWGPLAGKASVPGLTDAQGCFWRSVAQVVPRANADEVERELRAQIERAEGLRIPITHLDSHMGTLFARADYFERFMKVGVERRIPILAVGGHSTHARIENGESMDQLKAWIPKIWNAGLPVLDDLHTGTYGWPPGEKTARLVELLKSLKPGVTEILFHASVPTDDFPLVTGSSASRLADVKALTSPEVKRVIEERGIIRTTWKELMERRGRARPLPSSASP